MINFSHVLKDMDGKPMKDVLPVEGTGEPRLVDMTLGRLCANVLLTPLREEEGKIAGTEHLRRFMLAAKVRDEGAIELPAEDVALLKDRVAKVCSSSMVVGRAWLMLDPASGTAPAPAKKNARRRG